LPRPYSSDLRARAVEAVEAGASRREAAERYEISASAVVLWTQRWEQTGSFAAARTRSSVGVVVGPARGRAASGPSRHPSRHRAEVKRHLCRVETGQGPRARNRDARAAIADSQRAHEADEGPGLRFGLRLRPRRRGGLLRPGYFPNGMERRTFYSPEDAAGHAPSRSASNIGPSCEPGETSRRLSPSSEIYN
jgi:hypothetical protein